MQIPPTQHLLLSLGQVWPWQKAGLFLTRLWLQRPETGSPELGGKRICKAFSCGNGCPRSVLCVLITQRKSCRVRCVSWFQWFSPRLPLSPLLWTLRCAQPTGSLARSVPSAPGSQPAGPAPPAWRGSPSAEALGKVKSWASRTSSTQALSLLCPFKEHALHLIYFQYCNLTNCHFDKGLWPNQPLQVITLPDKVDSLFVYKVQLSNSTAAQDFKIDLFSPHGLQVVFPLPPFGKLPCMAWKVPEEWLWWKLEITSDMTGPYDVYDHNCKEWGNPLVPTDVVYSNLTHWKTLHLEITAFM